MEEDPPRHPCLEPLPPPPVLSAWELEAERLFYSAMYHRTTFRESVTLAKALERESPEAAAYLRWLLSRGQLTADTWPSVN